MNTRPGGLFHGGANLQKLGGGEGGAVDRRTKQGEFRPLGPCEGGEKEVRDLLGRGDLGTRMGGGGV